MCLKTIYKDCRKSKIPVPQILGFTALHHSEFYNSGWLLTTPAFFFLLPHKWDYHIISNLLSDLLIRCPSAQLILFTEPCIIIRMKRDTSSEIHHYIDMWLTLTCLARFNSYYKRSSVPVFKIYVEDTPHKCYCKVLTRHLPCYYLTLRHNVPWCVFNIKNNQTTFLPIYICIYIHTHTYIYNKDLGWII